jgi:ATP-binding cassette subfamily F protein 3
LLGCFLFSNDDVFKPLGVLSGGERNRYALARMLLHPSNFLLLDEPTNHLDMRAKDVLLTALQEYAGTVVFVSRDRYFIDKLATRVFEVGGGAVEVFPGNYEDYLWRKQGGPARVNPVLPSSAQSLAEEQLHSNGGKSTIEQAAQQETKSKRLNPIKLKQMNERIGEIEEEITKLEAGIVECEQALLTYVSAEETARQMQLLGDRREDLDRLMSEWEELSLLKE